MRYIPHTEADVAQMLRVIGAPSVDALFAQIPPALRMKRPLAIEALDEIALLRHLGEISARSLPAVDGPEGTISFLGAGVVPHHVPTAVDALLMRAEWYTSYTPYQPEISQGTLQAVFEFQTVVAELFGPAAVHGETPTLVANASMYDGASAAAEAVLMARRITLRDLVVMCGAVHPQYRETIECYLAGLAPSAGPGAAVATANPHVVLTGLLPDGRVDLSALSAAFSGHKDGVACVVVQTPNYLGVVEDLRPIATAAHAHGALLVVACAEPLAMGLLKPPGSLGADIICGDGLGLAIPPTLGGPGVGLFAARTELVRQMPGRLVGETVDGAGRRGYVLTLATREQHIRRDKATSNICTNHGLIALAFTIHLCLLGRRGLSELARLNLSKARYARERLLALRGFQPAVTGPTFNEFAVRVRGGKAAGAVERLADQGIFAGVSLDRPGFALPALAGAPPAEETLLLAVTECHRKEDIDRLARALDEVCP